MLRQEERWLGVPKSARTYTDAAQSFREFAQQRPVKRNSFARKPRPVEQAHVSPKRTDEEKSTGIVMEVVTTVGVVRGALFLLTGH